MTRLSLLCTALTVAAIALTPRYAHAGIDPATGSLSHTLDLTGLDLSRSTDWNIARQRIHADAVSICHTLDIQAGDGFTEDEAACVRDSEDKAMRNLADLRDSSPAAPDLTTLHPAPSRPILAAATTPHA